MNDAGWLAVSSQGMGPCGMNCPPGNPHDAETLYSGLLEEVVDVTWGRAD